MIIIFTYFKNMFNNKWVLEYCVKNSINYNLISNITYIEYDEYQHDFKLLNSDIFFEKEDIILQLLLSKNIDNNRFGLIMLFEKKKNEKENQFI